MVRVKICGITNQEDALHAASCGADALGFVFYPGSPRCVTPAQVRAMGEALPPFVTRVGLFVNETPERIRAIAGECGLDVLQLHGDEPPEACLLPPYRVIKGVRPRSADDLGRLAAYPVAALLVDAAVPGQFGGTGQRADWQLAAQLAATRRVILAGGLTPANVSAAVQAVRPYGVDVASGVEQAPGRKDPEKVAQFIRMAKEAC
ncbi:MAG: phosphoribosylanthranilate isomerase [Desulfuromonadales bacterium]|nr:phosphoribosylanthranilate isomerase [Desulfuromonadales bacterium]